MMAKLQPMRARRRDRTIMLPTVELYEAMAPATEEKPMTTITAKPITQADAQTLGYVVESLTDAADRIAEVSETLANVVGSSAPAYHLATIAVRAAARAARATAGQLDQYPVNPTPPTSATP